jgi:hypothetical protein
MDRLLQASPEAEAGENDREAHAPVKKKRSASRGTHHPLFGIMETPPAIRNNTSRFARSQKFYFSCEKTTGVIPWSIIVVQYFKDSPNAFRRLWRRGNPPAKMSSFAANRTISSF